MEEGVYNNNTGKKFKLNDTQPSNLNFIRDDSQDFKITRQYEDIIYIPNVSNSNSLIVFLSKLQSTLARPIIKLKSMVI